MNYDTTTQVSMDSWSTTNYKNMYGYNLDAEIFFTINLPPVFESELELIHIDCDW